MQTELSAEILTMLDCKYCETWWGGMWNALTGPMCTGSLVYSGVYHVVFTVFGAFELKFEDARFKSQILDFRNSRFGY